MIRKNLWLRFHSIRQLHGLNRVAPQKFAIAPLRVIGHVADEPIGNMAYLRMRHAALQASQTIPYNGNI